MKKSILYLLFPIVFVLFRCAESEMPTEKNPSSPEVHKAFSQELSQLKDYFQIPGMAARVIHNDQVVYNEFLGHADVEKQLPVDSTTLFPIASVTKTFSAVLLLKLVEQGKLSLETPIQNYFPESEIDSTILLKHVLSHTSQGTVGKKFYYSSRFRMLTKVIEEVTGKSFEENMQEEIFEPLQLTQTFLLKDPTQTTNLAQPYLLDGGVQKGFIDYGFSTSAGIVSNLEDLQKFSKSLDENVVISEKSKAKMFAPFNGSLPYGYGIFSQTINDKKVVWAYGQYDCHSSLFLKVPSENLTLILLANNNLMSDPARLIYGDASASLFAMSFLKNYVFQFDKMPLLENTDSLVVDKNISDFYRKKLLAQALAESFMARHDPNKMYTSAKILQKVFAQNDEYLKYGNLNLLHTLSFLKDVAFYMELGDFNEFDVELEVLGTKLLKEDPENPYVNIYLGSFYDRKGEKEKARKHYQTIVQAKNFSPFWYTREAENWLKQNPK